MQETRIRTGVTLAGMTIAVENLEAMAGFYRRVFGAELRPVQMGGAKLYAGRMAGLAVQLCPKEVAGIAAADNIHQLSFRVDDVRDTLDEALAAGGEQIGDIQAVDGAVRGWIRDPDGNSIELAQG